MNETTRRTDRRKWGIDLLEMLAVLLDKAWVIILVGVLTAGAAFGYTKFMVTPIYQATTQAYVLTRQRMRR